MAQSGAGTWMSLSTPTGPGRVPDSGAGTLGRRAWDVPQETVLDCIEPESIDRLKMPQNFIRYAFSFPHRRLEEIRDLLEEWGQWDDLRSLANYHSVVKKLFDLLKDSFVVCTGRSHSIATEMSKKISRDVSLLHERLAAILCEKGTCKSFFACRGDLAQQLLDLSQDLLDCFPKSPWRPLLSKALLRLSHESGLHPTCFALSGLQKVGRQVAAGAFGDIWRGLVRGQSVSVKMVRLFQDAEVKVALQDFGREALIWRQLSHPNLLPFFGLYYLENRLCLVSPWMSHGHVVQFLKNAPPDTDRVSLILDIAMGLDYLHSEHVVHGDLKGMNILVTPSRRACVADFGLSSIVDAMTLRFTHSTASVRGGTERYQAPELLSGTSSNHFKSDVYAFACVCYEILTSKAPFYEIQRDVTVSLKVLTEGLRPTRPATIHDSLWVLLQDCWAEKPADRPDVAQIIERLVSTSIGATAAQAATDWDETFSSRCRRSLQDWPLLPSVIGIERKIFGNHVVDACPECAPLRLDAPRVPSRQADRPGTPSKRPRRSPPPGYSSPSFRKASWRPSSILSTSTESDFDPAHPPPPSSGWTRMSVPISCLTGANHYVPIHSDDRPPQMCQVFVSTHDLAVHHAASEDLPPLPLPSRGPSPQQRPPTPNNFASLLDDYLKMRAQPADSDVEGGTKVTRLADAVSGSHNPTGLLQLPSFGGNYNFDTSGPLFGPPRGSVDVSPQETEYDEFSTSPGDDSPFGAFLSTPLVGADNALIPLMDDLWQDNSQMSLFGGSYSSFPSYLDESTPLFGSGGDGGEFSEYLTASAEPTRGVPVFNSRKRRKPEA